LIYQSRKCDPCLRHITVWSFVLSTSPPLGCYLWQFRQNPSSWQLRVSCIKAWTCLRFFTWTLLGIQTPGIQTFGLPWVSKSKYKTGILYIAINRPTCIVKFLLRSNFSVKSCEIRLEVESFCCILKRVI
jgi:hypothetical protein